MQNNSTQLWYAGTVTQFGDMQKIYDDETLWTLESKDGKWASVILDGVDVYNVRGEGAWNLARKVAESHMLKREQLQQEGWVTA
jgi:hypothetical protein